MSEEKTTYKGFSVGDRVYYYKNRRDNDVNYIGMQKDEI